MNAETTGKYDLGFIFYPPDHPSDPGHPRLDVFLRAEPTSRHFDPDQVDVPTVSELGHIEKLRIQHPWPGPFECRTAPDFITLIDRKGKVVEAFTFGGEMRVVNDGKVTTCTITSPAPILGMLYPDNIASILAREVEILFAERRAAWSHDLKTYDKHLASADPMTLYLACLKALREKFEHLPHSTDIMQHFTYFLNHEATIMHHIHPLYSNVPDLKDIL